MYHIGQHIDASYNQNRLNTNSADCQQPTGISQKSAI
jgi:hypothetical protein